ncbi:hypothetical protein [Spirosoma fluminis]
MAKKFAPDSKPVRSFEIDGIVYTDGDKLQVIAPELGVLPVVVKFEDYSNHHIMSMDFGNIRTPLPCRSNSRPDSPNATLHVSFTRMPATGPNNSIKAYVSNVMRLVYFCLCSSSKHTDLITWDVTIDTGIIRAEGIGRNTNGGRYNHPLVEGYQHLEPISYEQLKAEPIETDKHGQFKLF